MAYEVRITATFTTGSSADYEDVAKVGCQKVLGEMLREHKIITIPGGVTGIFGYKVDKIEAEKL